MENLIYFFIFLFGLMVGSFLNCVIYRFETGGNFLIGRSFCPQCKHILAWRDLIPLLSFLALKGKCRYCSQRISWQYPLVELMTGTIFLLFFSRFLSSFLFFSFPHVYHKNGFGWVDLFFYLIISCFLIIIFVYDLKHYIIPDKAVYPAIIVSFLYQLFKIWNPNYLNLFRIYNLGLAILPSLFFLTIILSSQGRWMGMGDFKLAILMGLILGFPKILISLFFAFWLGAIIGIGLIILGRKTFKSEIPFGPFLVVGTFVALFWGEGIIGFYFNLLTI